MKAWRHEKSRGPHKNRQAARRAGSTNRNAYFAAGSALVRWVLARGDTQFLAGKAVLAAEKRRDARKARMAA